MKQAKTNEDIILETESWNVLRLILRIESLAHDA